MQFVPDGPHVPDELIQDFANGDGVLFCGAGVSKSAGLPLFDELVEQVYARLHLTQHSGEAEEFEKDNFDRVLGLLERPERTVPQAVRNAIQKILTLPADGNLPFHRALLELSRTVAGEYRLVTTNFDRGFAIADRSLTFEVAPALPPARKSRWRRPLHLHGLIGADGRTLDDLVLTSADFGEAYITTGWASRFVTELFARFKVLFVGYSLNDPVMRYLVDAISVAKSRGEHRGAVYALVPAADQEDSVRQSWKAKGVDAIPYHKDDTHSLLVDTVQEWANLQRQGHFGRIEVIRRLADDPINRPFKQDYRVSQVLWALKDDASGQAAREFASLSPPPPVGWLKVFEENGLLELPAEPPHQGWSRPQLQPVHPVSAALREWLLNHLDKRELIERVIDGAGFLEPGFRQSLCEKLDHPQETVPQPYRRFWELVANSSAIPTVFDHVRAFDIVDQLQAGSRDPSLLLQALDQIKPVVRLSRSFMGMLRGDPNASPQNLDDLVELEVELVAGDATYDLVSALATFAQSDAALRRRILLEVTGHLLRAMELFRCAGQAHENHDPSVLEMQSLNHDPPPGLHQWTALVSLLRRGVCELSKDGPLAVTIFELWRCLPYPVFQRLALLVLRETQALSPAERARLLVAEARRLLWPLYAQEFSVPLVAAIWEDLPKRASIRFIKAILAGPPRDLFAALSEPVYERIAEDSVCELLHAMAVTGKPLPRSARLRLDRWHERQRQTAAAQQLVPNVEEETQTAIEQYKAFTIPEILQDVRDRVASARPCDGILRLWSARNPDRAEDLAEVMFDFHFWDPVAWQSILEGMSSLGSVPARVGAIVQQLPRTLLCAAGAFVAGWLSRTKDDQPLDADFFGLWDALIAATPAQTSVGGGDILTAAINSPTGKLCEVMLRRFLSTSPKVGSRLPSDIARRLSEILGAEPQRSRFARVIAALYLYALHAIDQAWARSVLLPMFRWEHEAAPDVWVGYLHNAHLYPDLIVDLKPALLEALAHRSQLGESGKYLCRLLAQIIANSPRNLTNNEVGAALQSLNCDGLASVVSSFADILRSTKETERARIWADGIHRAFSRWPADKVGADFSGQLARMAVESSDGFPDVVRVIKPLLRAISVQDLPRLAHRLERTTLPERYPREVLQLLASLVASGSAPRAQLPRRWGGERILRRIHAVEPALARTPEFDILERTGWFHPR